MSKKLVFLFAALGIFVSGIQQPRAYADSITFTTTVNTSSLTSGSFALSFQFTDGSGSGDGNNTVSLSGFNFGGGSAGAVNSGLSGGGATGDLTTGIILTDSTGFYNAFVSGFTPGSALSFTVSMTTNVDAGGTPDQFSFGILQNCASGCTNIATADPSGADSFLTVNVDSGTPGTNTFSSLDGSIAAPTATSNVPEPPTTLLLFVSGVMGGMFHLGRRIFNIRL